MSSHRNPKYKTELCRHFESGKGCMHKDKCEFAHGVNDLITSSGNVSYNIFTYIYSFNNACKDFKYVLYLTHY